MLHLCRLNTCTILFHCLYVWFFLFYQHSLKYSEQVLSSVRSTCFPLVTGIFIHIKVSIGTVWKKTATKMSVQTIFIQWVLEPCCVLFVGLLLNHIVCSQATCSTILCVVCRFLPEPHYMFAGHTLSHIVCCLQATCWAPVQHHMYSHGGAQVALIVVALLQAPPLVGPHVPLSITGSHTWAGGRRNGSQDHALRQSDWLQGCCPLSSSNSNSS
jgi:hypothetical protein